MFLEYVALEDVENGEEIFFDYSDSWEKSLEFFGEIDWEPPPFRTKYISAADLTGNIVMKPIRIVAEQRDQKHPTNIITTCLFEEPEESFKQDDITWTLANNGCLPPCRIQE